MAVREAIVCEWMSTLGNEGPSVPAYVARPVGGGPFPGVVLLHHVGGLDQPTREAAYRIASHGYVVVVPDLHAAEAPGLGREEAAAYLKSLGGVTDSTALLDVAAAKETLRVFGNWSGKAAVLGFCSGGRQAYIAAARIPFDAAVVCYGTRLIPAPDDITERRPLSPISLTQNIGCPILMVFGEIDPNPSPAHAAQIESELVRFGKEYEFETYPGAGHAFLDPYRGERYSAINAKPAWERIFGFFERNLSK